MSNQELRQLYARDAFKLAEESAYYLAKNKINLDITQCARLDTKIEVHPELAEKLVEKLRYEGYEVVFVNEIDNTHFYRVSWANIK